MNDHTTTDDLSDWMQAASEVEQVRGGQLAILVAIAVAVVLLAFVA